jgi:hypothetical protein
VVATSLRRARGENPAWPVLPGLEREDYVSGPWSRADALQCERDFRIIVVNDASTDRTQEIAEGLAARHRLVRVINYPVNLKLAGPCVPALRRPPRTWWCTPTSTSLDLNELERVLHLMSYLEADISAPSGSTDLRGHQAHPLLPVYNALSEPVRRQ